MIQKITDVLERVFKINERGSTVKKELLGGLAIFLAMAYILPVNAGMLSQIGMPYGGVFLATALAAIIATLIMALLANFPIALAPGMGINAFFAFTMVFQFGFSWQESLAASMIAGVLFIGISLTGVRTIIINSIPKDLKFAIGAGIGFFIAFIGLQNSKIIVASPATMVQLGDLSNPSVLLTVFGLFMVSVLLILRNRFSSFALIITMVTVAAGGWIIYEVFSATGSDTSNWGLPNLGDSLSISDLGSIDQIFGKAFEGIETLFDNKHWFLAIFTFLFVDFFDTAGTLVAVGNRAGLVDSDTGEIKDGSKALMADSIGTVTGAILGTSTTTAFVESQVGVEQGARTGLSALVVSIMFAIAIPLLPIISLFNNSVTSIALIVVGALMIEQLKEIDWEDKIISIASFMTIIFIILTYSINIGIAVGILFYTVLSVFDKIFGDGERDISKVMIALSIIFVIYYAVEYSGVL